MSEQALADLGLNVLRTPLVTVPGAAIPLPFGGKSRQVQIDLDSRALQGRGLSGQDVANALAIQNLITPVGTQKIGKFEYNDPAQQFAFGDERAGQSADQERQRRDGLSPRRGASARRQSAADQHRPCRRWPIGPDAGAQERLGLDPGDHRRHQAAGRGDQAGIAGGNEHRSAGRSIHIREGRGRRRGAGRRHRRRADQPDDPAVPGQLAVDTHHRDLDPALGPGLDHRRCRSWARRSTS